MRTKIANVLFVLAVVLVGIGAIILDGAKIGNNCIVAAGSVVKEGETVPDNTLVAGIPAKFKRILTENDIERVKYSATSYIEKIRNH